MFATLMQRMGLCSVVNWDDW